MNPVELENVANTASVLMLSGQMEEFLRVLHIIGISMGLGGSLFADYLSFDMLMLPGRNGITEARTITRIHWFIFAGLGLIWLSGIGIALNKFTFDTVPNKLVVKIIVVTALSINAVMIGRYLVPISKKYQSPILRFMSKKDIRVSTFIICVSITCWFSALFVSKIVALQQMSILLLLFVIGGSYFILFMAVRGFLNYAKSILLSGSSDFQPEHTHNIGGSNIGESSIISESSMNGSNIGGAPSGFDYAANNVGGSLHTPPSMKASASSEAMAAYSSNPAAAASVSHHSMRQQSVGRKAFFARGMTFQYSTHFLGVIDQTAPLNFSSAFPNPHESFPWFDSLEISNQMSLIGFANVSLKPNVSPSPKGAATRTPVTHKQHLASRPKPRATRAPYGDDSKHHLLKDDPLKQRLAAQSVSENETPKRRSSLRGRVPLVSQPSALHGY